MIEQVCRVACHDYVMYAARKLHAKEDLVLVIALNKLLNFASIKELPPCVIVYIEKHDNYKIE